MPLLAVMRLTETPANDWYKRRCTDDIRTIFRSRRVG